MAEEETREERRERWMEREAKKAEEGGRKAKKVRCSKCGKEVDEFMEIAGRALCLDCYAEEEMEEMGAMAMPGEGSGGG
jgi:protein-arginine kinase activator protein McsA